MLIRYYDHKLGGWLPGDSTNMRPLHKKILVEPEYDADKIGSFYIPEAYMNPLSQQGVVLAVGPEQETIRVGDRVLYHPWSEIEKHGEQQKIPVMKDGKWEEAFILDEKFIVGWLAPDGVLFPLPDFIVLDPKFSAGDAHEAGMVGSLHVVGQAFDIEPPQQGKVASIGERVTTIHVGDIVLYPIDKGNEIGLINKVWYTIREEDILARLIYAKELR